METTGRFTRTIAFLGSACTANNMGMEFEQPMNPILIQHPLKILQVNTVEKEGGAAVIAWTFIKLTPKKDITPIIPSEKTIQRWPCHSNPRIVPDHHIDTAGSQIRAILSYKRIG